MKDFFLPERTVVDGFDLIGTSQAGIGTCLYFPQIGICFDVANGYLPALAAKTYFISHCHMDHASGIPYLISQKALNEMATPIFYMPESLIQPLTEIMTCWSRVEGFEYRFDFRPSQIGADILFAKNYIARSFSTIHRVPSCGYTIYQKKKALRPEFASLSRDEIKARALAGENVNMNYDEAIISFTGDTQVEVIEKTESLRKSRSVFMEVTYYDERRPVANAKQWGHTHFDEIIERLPLFECENLVFIHPSRRYSKSEINLILNQRLPREWIEKIWCFGLP